MSEGGVSEGRARVPLAELVRALSTELEAMGSMAERVQTTLAPSLLRLARDPAARVEAQTYDRLTQLLYGVAAFVGALHACVPEAWTVDAAVAAGGVTLADLADRLCCVTPAAQTGDAGELEVF